MYLLCRRIGTRGLLSIRKFSNLGFGFIRFRTTLRHEIYDLTFLASLYHWPQVPESCNHDATSASVNFRSPIQKARKRADARDRNFSATRRTRSKKTSQGRKEGAKGCAS